MTRIPINLRSASRYLGLILLLVGGAQLLPLICSLLYQEGGAAVSFLISAVASAAAGGLLWVWGRGADEELFRREGILIVAGGWVGASLCGALPYLLTGTLPGVVDALFESASGFTTTGATVLLDIEATGRGILFWRSFTQWLGGMGIIVLFVALLPELGPGARFLYKLEVPGPTAEALQPRIRETAAIVWKIYLTFTVAETLLLLAGGLSLFDALTHTFSTLSTGGFSPRNASIAAFDSPFVSCVVILFMILAGANFSLYYGMRTRAGRNLFRDPEFRLYVVLMVAATGVLSVDLVRHGAVEPVPRAMLEAAFQVVSILTTTGFATADFDQWPTLSRMLLVVLMFVGGCAGSTSGSMKVMRMVIGLKSALREVRLIFSPSAVVSIFVGGKAVPNPVVRSVAGFFILFLTSWGIGALLLTVRGADIVTAATASIATLGNVGPGLAGVGPVESYAFFGNIDKLLMVLLMWLGRLEVYSIAALFVPRFWRQ